MDEIKIVTDNKPRELKCFMDLSERERADFDYIKNDDFYSQRFVRYKLLRRLWAGAWLGDPTG